MFTADRTVHANYTKGEAVAGQEAADLPEARSKLEPPRGTRSRAEVFFQSERMGKSIVVKARKDRTSKRNPPGLLVAIFDDKNPIKNFALGHDKASVVSCAAKMAQKLCNMQIELQDINVP